MLISHCEAKITTLQRENDTTTIVRPIVRERGSTVRRGRRRVTTQSQRTSTTRRNQDTTTEDYNDK